MNTLQTLPRGRRLRRWLIALSVVGLLLGAFSIALDRIAQRIGADMQKNMRTTPGIDDRKHRAD